MKAKISHTILSVSDWEKATTFYDALMGALGFEPGRPDEKGEWGGIRAYRQGEHGLYIYHEGDKQYTKFNRFPGLNHIAFGVESRVDVDKIYELVKTLDVEITRKPKLYPEYTENYYAFYFRDPDGIPLEVMFS